MEVESGFFDADGLRNFEGAGSGDKLTDFHVIYTSESGFAQVHLAKRQGKLFVVKSLKPELVGDMVACAALRKEYDTLFPVDSPYVVHAYEFTSLKGLGPAIVMEYCPGETLADCLQKKEPLSDEDVRAIVEGLLKGLEAIHISGVVHRDIKPSNLIYYPPTKSLRIIDFGCADGGGFYLFNKAAGTPGFASPDLYSDSYRTSLKDDYYSAGMTLSALIPLCSARTAKLLGKISGMLIKGKRPDPTLIFSSGGRSSKRKRRGSVAIAVVLVLLMLGSLYNKYHRPERKNLRNVAVSHISKEPESTQSEEKPSEEKSLTPETVPSPGIEPSVSIPEEKDNVEAPAPVIKPGDEKIPEVNGVGYHEAKYSANYRRNDADRVAVMQTDSYLLMNLKTMEKDNVSKEDFEKAAMAFADFDTLWNYVERRLESQLGEFDRRRAEGIVYQRRRYWIEENYRPYIPK